MGKLQGPEEVDTQGTVCVCVCVCVGRFRGGIRGDLAGSQIAITRLSKIEVSAKEGGLPRA